MCLGLAVPAPWHAPVLASTGVPPAVRDAAPLVQLWVELDMPALAAAAAGTGTSAAAAKAVEADLLKRMRALGAVELGRVRVLRHAIAVAVPADRVDALRALEGVRRVTPVRHVDRPPPTGPR